jgi:predicted TIM-barrel fold metal-dependent hydrolase
LPGGDFHGVAIVDEGGQLVEACEPILRMIASHDAVLATGHISPEESLVLLRCAKQCGVKRMLVTHASESVTPWTHEQQQVAVSLGAVIEHCFFAATPSCPNPTSLASILQQIRVIGAEHVVLSSDFGQVANGDPVEGFAHYLEKMITLGLPREALSLMIRENPSKLVAQNRREGQGDFPTGSK